MQKTHGPHWKPDHNQESEANASQILVAVDLANRYPDIVKVLAVGNEAMVHWAATYFVQPSVILKWVNHLQGLKKEGKLPKDLWVTSSDDFSSWGGLGTEYHTEDLEKIIPSCRLCFQCILILITIPIIILISGEFQKQRKVCQIWKKSMRQCSGHKSLQKSNMTVFPII